MYRAELDKERKIVFVELFDHFSVEESYEATKDFWAKMASIGRGGYVICDISKFKAGTRGSGVVLQKVMKLVDSYEPKAVIRIVDGFSGAMKFDRAYTRVGAHYKVYRVEDKEEAIKIVDTIENIPLVFNSPPSVN